MAKEAKKNIIEPLGQLQVINAKDAIDAVLTFYMEITFMTMSSLLSLITSFISSFIKFRTVHRQPFKGCPQ